MSKIATSKKNCQKLSFFPKKIVNLGPMAIFEKKNTILGNFWEKISSFWQFLDIQMVFFPRIRFDVTV